MTKLILIEGIPGSGKSTIAEKIAERYRGSGQSVNLYLEGPGHPVELGWFACFSDTQYNELLRLNSTFRSIIGRIAIFDAGYVLVPFSEIQSDDEDLSKQWEAFDCYNGFTRVSDDVCLHLLCNRWRKFGECEKDTTTLNIFEAALFQSQMERLLLWGNADEKTITMHLQKIVDSVNCLAPVLIYLSQPDCRETILRTAKERVSSRGSWIDFVISHCESAPFWQKNNLVGLEGALEFYAVRKQMELKAIEQLSIPYKIVEKIDNNWDGVWKEINTFLDEIV
jgi:hypothetical protein